MKYFYTSIVVITTLLLLLAAKTANAQEGVARQLKNQSAPGVVQPLVYPPGYYPPPQQPQYIPQDNDDTYRLPGQYSPTLNDLRRQFPQQQVPVAPAPYNQYEQNDTGRNTGTYYYQ